MVNSFFLGLGLVLQSVANLLCHRAAVEIKPDSACGVYDGPSPKI